MRQRASYAQAEKGCESVMITSFTSSRMSRPARVAPTSREGFRNGVKPLRSPDPVAEVNAIGPAAEPLHSLLSHRYKFTAGSRTYVGLELEMRENTFAEFWLRCKVLTIDMSNLKIDLHP